MSRAHRRPSVSECLGSPHPAAQPPDTGLRPSPLTGGVSGVLASLVARWALMLDGDRPQGLPMAAGGGAAFTAVAGSQEAKEWAKVRLHAIRGARVQIRRRVARSRVPRGHIKTRHHNVCSGLSPRVPGYPRTTLSQSRCSLSTGPESVLSTGTSRGHNLAVS